MVSVQEKLSDTKFRKQMQRLLDASEYSIPHTLSTDEYEIELWKGYDVKGYYVASFAVYCGKTKTTPPTFFRIFKGGSRYFPIEGDESLELDIYGYSAEGSLTKITEALKNRGYEIKLPVPTAFWAKKRIVGHASNARSASVW